MKSLAKLERIMEAALAEQEMVGDLEGALRVYLKVEEKLLEHEPPLNQSLESERQRLLAYCLMRQGNIQRLSGNPEAASRLSQRELSAARASGDPISLARSLMSVGTSRVLQGEIEAGLGRIIEARELFEAGESYDHRQGLGWSWVLEADLGNAGLLRMEHEQILDAAERARSILEPIENWPGVARAYAARAATLLSMGEKTAAEEARQAQQRFEEMG
jgi:hypothetical protein